MMIGMNLELEGPPADQTRFVERLYSLTWYASKMPVRLIIDAFP